MPRHAFEGKVGHRLAHQTPVKPVANGWASGWVPITHPPTLSSAFDSGVRDWWAGHAKENQATRTYGDNVLGRLISRHCKALNSSCYPPTHRLPLGRPFVGAKCRSAPGMGGGDERRKWGGGGSPEEV